MRAVLVCAARYALLLVLALALAGVAAGCRPATEGPIAFDEIDTVTAAEASATAVPVTASQTPDRNGHPDRDRHARRHTARHADGERHPRRHPDRHGYRRERVSRGA